MAMTEILLRNAGGAPLALWLVALLVLCVFVLRCRKVRVHFKSKRREFLFETDASLEKRSEKAAL